MDKKAILIVDDDPVFTRATSARLTAEGFETITAPDCSEAMSAIRLRKPDLIIVDLLYKPDVAHGGGVAWDGFLIVDWLRRMGSLTTTPVILFTGSDPAPYAERARKSKFVGLFHKGVEPGIFVATVHRILGTATATTAQPVE